jgi:cell division septum initiation protein DivIVA
MSESNRKQSTSKTGRASRRGVLRRGSRREDEEAPQAKGQADTRATTARKGSDDAGLDDDGKVSSLLETTSAEVKQLLEAADDAAEKIREAARTEAGSGEGNETTALIGQINTEVQEVLESADEAGEKIRAEAREEARRLIEESRRRAESVTSEQMNRVTEMTDQVFEQLSAVQGQLETLQAAVGRSIKAMSSDLGVEPADVWETQQNGEPEGEEESADLRRRLGRRPQRPKTAHEPQGISEGARLLALQQHTAGVDAETIEKRLKEQFGIEDPKPVLEWMGLFEKPEKPEKSEKPEKPEKSKER